MSKMQELTLAPIGETSILELLDSLRQFRKKIISALDQGDQTFSSLNTDHADNPYLGIDAISTDLLLPILNLHLPTWKIWTEELGSLEDKSTDCTIFIDPFCNTSLASKGVRVGATAISLIKQSGEFMNIVIDYQWPCIVFGNLSACYEYNINSGRYSRLIAPNVVRLEDAAGCISLFKRKRREYIARYSRLITIPELLFDIDGAVNVARMARGVSAFFLDLDVGQPSYELLPYFMLQALGFTLLIDGERDLGAIQDISEELLEGIIRRIPILVAPASIARKIVELIS